MPSESPLSKYLKGEVAPSTEQLRGLLDLAKEIQRLEPWKRISDQQVMAVANRFTGEPVFLCIMGMLGEFLAVQCFLGEEGFGLYQRIRDGLVNSAADMFSRSRYVQMEWVFPKEFETFDKPVLASVGYDAKPRSRHPVLRAVRPGYWPWAPTADEATVLEDCLRVALAAARDLEYLESKFWRGLSGFPLAKPAAGRPGEYTWSSIDEPEPKPMARVAPELDRARVDRILAANYGSGGCMDIDHQWMEIQIGEKNERKGLMQMAVAVDGDSGFAFMPKTSLAGPAPGDLMQDVLLDSIEKTKRIPVEVQVRGPESRVYLEAAAQALGIRLKFAYSMPGLDHAMRMLARAL